MADTILEWLADRVFPWVMIVVIAICLGAIPFIVGYSFWQSSRSSTLNLEKSEWVCTRSQPVPMTTSVLIGKVIVPLTTYHEACQQWSRR